MIYHDKEKNIWWVVFAIPLTYGGDFNIYINGNNGEILLICLGE